jgi:DUF4097 and DUF4098 domain-containing protein YvlB
VQMQRTMTVPVLLIAALACVVLGGCGTGLAIHRKTELATVPHVAGSAIKIASKNGKIHVERVEGLASVEVETEARSSSLERLDLAHLELNRLSDNTLSIHMEWPEGKRARNEGASFTVRVPDANGVDLRSSNGRIEAIGLGGHAEIVTSNGSVIVDRHAGDINVRTSNGSIQILEPAGDVTARSSNGRIRVKDAPAHVNARSSNGPLTILLTDDNPGPVDLSTSNGSIKLGLGSAFQGRLLATTSNASISMADLGPVTLKSQSKHRVEIVIGEHVHDSKVSTSNGSITVERPF